MTGNKILRIVMVSIIALAAAAGSFDHIRSLVLSHGQPWWMALIYPIMVDAMIVFASVTLSSRAVNRPTRLWCRLGLVLGVAGSLSANALSSDLSDTVTCAIAVFPSVILIVTVEILLHSVKGVRHGRAARRAGRRSLEDQRTQRDALAAARARRASTSA